MDITQFKGALTGGGARGNQFKVIPTFPTGVGILPATADSGQYLITAASLPGSNLGKIDTNYRGRRIAFAGERSFAPWEITVLNDTDFAIRNAFEKWMDFSNDVVTGKGKTDISDYVADFTVIQLDRNENPLKTYKLVGAWPIDISEIALSFNQNSTIETFTVKLEYLYVESFEKESSTSINAKVFSQ
jgi:hypothetical protein